MSVYPKSPKEMTGGMMYFRRMLDKIRLHARGELGDDYHANLGQPRTADGSCSNFLRVKYDDLRDRVLAGGTDEEILEWCLRKRAPAQWRRPGSLERVHFEVGLE